MKSVKDKIDYRGVLRTMDDNISDEFELNVTNQVYDQLNNVSLFHTIRTAIFMKVGFWKYNIGDKGWLNEISQE